MASLHTALKLLAWLLACRPKRLHSEVDVDDSAAKRQALDRSDSTASRRRPGSTPANTAGPSPGAPLAVPSPGSSGFAPTPSPALLSLPPTPVTAGDETNVFLKRPASGGISDMGETPRRLGRSVDAELVIGLVSENMACVGVIDNLLLPLFQWIWYCNHCSIVSHSPLISFLRISA